MGWFPAHVWNWVGLNGCELAVAAAGTARQPLLGLSEPEAMYPGLHGSVYHEKSNFLMWLLAQATHWNNLGGRDVMLIFAVNLVGFRDFPRG